MILITVKKDLRVDFKRTVTNSRKNSKYISKRRPPVVFNAHTENQTAFPKVAIIPGDKSYSSVLTKKQSREIYWILVTAYQV